MSMWDVGYHGKCMRAYHGCMASALGPLDVRPDFRFHISRSLLVSMGDLLWSVMLVDDVYSSCFKVHARGI